LETPTANEILDLQRQRLGAVSRIPVCLSRKPLDFGYLEIPDRRNRAAVLREKELRMNEPVNRLIIIGSAPDVLIDIAGVPRALSYDFMAIGLDAVDKYRGPILYCATYHPVEIPEILKRREQAGGNLDYKIISMETRPGVDIVEPFRPPSGSSSLLGTLAAIRMGYRRIILCGCPLTGKNAAGGTYETFRNGWEARANEFAGRVRSMSGWTREFLGAPMEEWLNG
jgi:hypothetical protein